MKNYIKYFNIIAFLVMVFINYIIGFRMQPSVSTIFTPAGYVFSIWILIYLLLLLSLINQNLPSNASNPYIEKIEILFMITSLLNILWLLAWNQEKFYISWVIMLMLFIILWIIYAQLDINNFIVSIQDKIFIQIPFSIYFAWITVALFANTFSVLKYSGILTADNELLFSMIAVIIIVAFTIWLTSKNNDIFYLSVIIWALIGIVVKNFGAQNVLVLVTVVGIIILIIQWLYKMEDFKLMRIKK